MSRVRGNSIWTCSTPRWRIIWRGKGRDSLFVAAGRIRVRVMYPWMYRRMGLGRQDHSRKAVDHD